MYLSNKTLLASIAVSLGVVGTILFQDVNEDGNHLRNLQEENNDALSFVTGIFGWGNNNNRKKFPSILNWNLDEWLPEDDKEDSAQRLSVPSLTQPFYNAVYDVHSTVDARDTELIFSTNGNWHWAMRKLLTEQYFPANPSVQSSNLLTTSPPISVAQMTTGKVKVGNILFENAQPHVICGPGAVLNALEEQGLVQSGFSRIPIIRTYGNVILKRKGYRKVKSFWDLRKLKAGRFASSDTSEGGSYNNYRTSVLNIALQNPRTTGNNNNQNPEKAANNLVTKLFDTKGVATIGPPMHRSLPHMIATNQADAGLFFLHLAVTAMRENPGVFTAVYLDSANGQRETDDYEELLLGQEPVAGNRVGTFSVVRSSTPTNTKQETAATNLIASLQSDEFTDILIAVGLRRPE